MTDYIDLSLVSNDIKLSAHDNGDGTPTTRPTAMYVQAFAIWNAAPYDAASVAVSSAMAAL